MTRPLLGIVACTRQADGETIHRVSDRYLRAPAQWSGVDVVIVPALAELADYRDLAARIDGLLLTGSTSNVAASRYGGGCGHGPFDAARDATSLTLSRVMLDAGRPVFGICRGFQELNVVFGGTLRHLPAAAQALHHAPADAAPEVLFAHHHAVTPVAGGVIARALGTAPIIVNSVHFQAVATLGAGLCAEAYAPDGLIEAFSAEVGTARVLGVQWHPECDAGHNRPSRWFFAALGEAMGADPAYGADDA